MLFHHGFRMCLSHLIYTGWPCLIHTCHAMLRPCRSSQGHNTARPSLNGRAVLWPSEERHGRSMAWSLLASVNQTRPRCVNQMGKTHSKPLAARHGRGTAWARHGNGMLCVNRPLDVSINLSELKFWHLQCLIFQF